jgi:hypothetical protein
LNGCSINIAEIALAFNAELSFANSREANGENRHGMDRMKRSLHFHCRLNRHEPGHHWPEQARHLHEPGYR